MKKMKIRELSTALRPSLKFGNVAVNFEVARRSGSTRVSLSLRAAPTAVGVAVAGAAAAPLPPFAPN